MTGSLLFHNTFIPELGQHLQHVDADLLRIIIQPCTYDAKAVRCQDATMQPVCLILLVLFVFFIRYLASFGPPIVSTSWNLPFRKTFEYDPLSQNSNSPMQNVRC